jgi:hypothetical protein
MVWWKRVLKPVSNAGLHGSEYIISCTLYSKDGNRAAEVRVFANGETYLAESESVDGTTFVDRHLGSMVGPFKSPELAESFIVGTSWFCGETKIEIIVAADEPALFFTSVRQAETYLEAIDVEDGVYSDAYGPAGEPYKLEAVSGRVRVTPLEGVEPQPDELRALLLRYLAANGVDRIAGTESLRSLLARCEGAAV